MGIIWSILRAEALDGRSETPTAELTTRSRRITMADAIVAPNQPCLIVTLVRTTPSEYSGGYIYD